MTIRGTVETPDVVDGRAVVVVPFEWVGKDVVVCLASDALTTGRLTRPHEHDGLRVMVVPAPEAAL